MTATTNIYQLTLMTLSAVQVTLSIYSFSRLSVYKGMKRYLYFSITCLAIAGYVFSQLLLSYPADPAILLYYHRMKIFFLIIAVAFWYFVIREMYLPDSTFPFIYMGISVILALFLPTDLFLSQPVTHLSVKLGSVTFDYRFGKTNICYIIYAVTQMTFPVYCLFKIWRAGITTGLKIIATVTILPLFSGFNDYAVTNRLIENIMIAEYAIWFFAVSTFIMLLMEDRSNNRAFVEAHRELEKSHSAIILLKSYLTNIIESMPSILIAADKDGIITQWNTAAERYTEVRAADALGKNVWDTIPAFTALKDFFSDVIENQKSVVLSREHFSFMKKNDDSSYSISMYPLIANCVNGVVIRIDDVTEIERTEDLLRQMQKMEIVGTLAGGLAHDFNNILSGIVGTVSIIRHDIQENENISPQSLNANIEIIEQVSRRAAGLVQQLLTLSHKSEISYVPSDLNIAIKHIMQICTSTFDKSVELRTYYAASPAIINGDPSQVEQVLLNLCVNAAHAMTIMKGQGERQGGILTVSVDRIFADEHFCKTHPEAQVRHYWVLSVQDTGVGMPENILGKIFDPFFSTKEKGKGTGLGLSMVYKIVQQHDGFISVYSEEGHGSIFNVYLPVLASPQATAAEPVRSAMPKGDGLVLIVDDEKIVRLLAAAILKACGYSVNHAENGEKAVDIFRADHEKIKFVLLDMNMPVKAGRETFFEMKEIDANVKVILSSGFLRDEQIDELINHGALDFISKPYTMEALAEVLAKYSDHKGIKPQQT